RHAEERLRLDGYGRANSGDTFGAGRPGRAMDNTERRSRHTQVDHPGLDQFRESVEAVPEAPAYRGRGGIARLLKVFRMYRNRRKGEERERGCGFQHASPRKRGGRAAVHLSGPFV